MSSPAKSPKVKATRRVGGVKQVRAESKAPRAANRPQQKKAIKSLTSDCSSHYLATLLDPENVHGACLPVSFPLPSRKDYCWVKGTFVTGNGTSPASSQGGIVLRLNAANNGTCVLFTDPNAAATYNGTIFPISTNNGVATASLNSSYATGGIATGALNVQYRIVSACLKVRYTGRDDAMGGTLVWLEHPDHADIQGVSDVNAKTFEQCQTTRVSREWQQINYSGPVNPGETDFLPGTAECNANYFIGCGAINAVTTESLSFEFEVHVNVEFIGRTVTGKTVSHSDLSGFSAIASGIKEYSYNAPLMPKDSGAVVKSVSKQLLDLAPYAATAMGIANSSLISAGAATALTGISKYASPMIMKAIGMK